MALRSAASSLSLAFPGLKSAFATQGIAVNRLFASVVEGYKYAKTHEWAKVDGDVATVGISDHAQAELGDVVFVDLPEVGQAVKAGEGFGVVESVKAASDVYSPVSGEVTEINLELQGKPATINSDPYKAGWIMKVKLSNAGEVAKLLDAKAYAATTDH